MKINLTIDATPEEVRFIMVDPKMLELSLYDSIPHLFSPVVTDPKIASDALKWAVAEMENRYRNMSQFAVRNITEYNNKLDAANYWGPDGAFSSLHALRRSRSLADAKTHRLSEPFPRPKVWPWARDAGRVSEQ